MSNMFDFEKALAALTGKDGILSPLIKQLTDAALKAELEQHLAEEDFFNCKSGTSRETIKSSSGSFNWRLRETQSLVLAAVGQEAPDPFDR